MNLYFIPWFVSRQNPGLIRVVCAQRGPLISVALPLHIAKTEQRLCTLILVEVTLQFSLLFGTNSKAQVKHVDIKGKLYTNSLVIDFPKKQPIAYENIDTCWGISNKFLPLLYGG